MMSRLTLLVTTLLGASQLNATHIIGGEFYYDHLGGSQYQVTLKLYRDCTGIAFDASAVIGVFDGQGGLLYTQSLSFPGGSFIPITLDSPCLTLPPDVCVETTSYTGIFDLPPTADGYQLTYQRCCRTAIISNLITPGDLGLTVTMRIPGSGIVSNSSARFNELPPVALCLNAPLIFDHSAFDPDGDSLTYELCTPYNGGTSLDPQPNPPSAPPYSFLPWAAGYSETYPIDSDPAIAIDPVTGQLTLTPTLQGSFTVGVCVKEYRDGVLLTETRRDFLFKVVPCDASVVAGIQPQPPSLLCSGLTMPFVNTSFGAQTWAWDFGDPDVVDDVSSEQNPTWTYQNQGTYVITQIANPGTTCADTVQTPYQVYLTPEPFVVPPEPFCGNDPVTLVAEGMFGAGSSLQWILGAGSVPQSSSDSIVTAQFAGPGVHEFSLLVAENGCTNSYTDFVTNYALPVAAFNTNPITPQYVGTVVDLTDASNGNGGTFVTWDWTLDSDPLGASAPFITWNTSWPGTYTITLQVTTADGCTDATSQDYQVLGGDIVIPNVFSPNSDGTNETFHITNVEFYHNQLTIYSRWGNKVYEVTNYKNQWDGAGLPDGTYFYVLQMDDGREYSGHLTILR